MTDEQEKILRTEGTVLEGGPHAPCLSNTACPGEGPRRPRAMEYYPPEIVEVLTRFDGLPV